MRYYIVESPSSTDLARRVNKLLAEGWELQGGVSVVSVTQYRETFYQAMVRQ